MKIAQVINNFSHTSIPVEMAELMALTHSVDVVSLYDTEDKAEEMGTLYSPHASAIFGCNAKNDLFDGIRRMKKILEDGNYDIIQTHHSLSAAIVSFFFFNKKKTKSKIVTTIHGNSHSYTTKQNLITGYIIHNVDGIVYNSCTTKNEMFNWQKSLIRSNTRQKVVYNGINTSRINDVNLDYAKNFREKNGLPEDAFLIVQIGRLEPVKNPLETIKAFAKYLETEDARKDVFLVIVGDGSQKELLKNTVESSHKLTDRVRFTGTIQRNDVYSLMHTVGIHIIPSLYEGFCNALFESLVVGNQVMVSNISVFNELVNKLEGIETFDPRDTEAIFQSLKKALCNPINRNTRAGYEKFARENFDISICKNNYISMYDTILKG